jgi:dynein heavy chain
MITPRTPLNNVVQLCTLIDSMMPAPDQNPTDDAEKTDKFFVFCLIWSMGACIVDEDREKFELYVK